MKKIGVLLPAALGCLLIAGFLNPFLTERRQAFMPAGQTDLREAPPLVAFSTVALGGFRGILADLLWVRATTLQDEGRFFEITQLAEWITRLEPTFSEVWSYHAWNIAYNISSLFDAPADRWRWVENGLTLLRDGGIRHNPGDPRLYGELGWFFLSKIGGYLDEMSGYYRVRLFESLDAVIPGGRAETAAARAEALQAVRLEPAILAEVDAAVGPLDWRLPESQALYWAWLGRKKAGPAGSIHLERLFYQSMVGACFRGRAAYLPASHRLLRLPRPDLLDTTLRVLDDALVRYPDDEGIVSARQHFLRQAVMQAHARGRDEQAARFLALYRVREPSSPADPAPFIEASVPRGRLVMEGVLDQVGAFLLEAATLKKEGQADRAARLEEAAARLHESLCGLLGPEERPRLQSLPEIRDGVLDFREAPP